MGTASAEYLILDMNANGPSKKGMSQSRRQHIADVMKTEKPLLMFLQEFNGKKDIHTWGMNVPDYFNNKGMMEGFIFDERKIELINPCDKETFKRMKNSIYDQYCLFSRLCVYKIKTKEAPNFEILCASWHGPYKISDKRKKSVFDMMLKYLLGLKEKEGNIPLLIGGDFNLKASDVKSRLRSDWGLELQQNTPNDSKDMFITSYELREMFRISNFEIMTQNSAFDHSHLQMNLLNINAPELPTGNEGSHESLGDESKQEVNGSGESSGKNLSPVEKKPSTSGDESKQEMKGPGESSRQNLSPVEKRTSPPGDEGKQEMKGPGESSGQILSPLEKKTSPSGDQSKQDMKGPGESSGQILSPLEKKTSPSGDESKQEMKGPGESSGQNMSPVEKKTSPSWDE